MPTARATLERVLAITKAAYGPDHSQVAITLTNLGIVQGQLGIRSSFADYRPRHELDPA